MIIVWANFRATRLESGRSPEWIARSKPSSMIVVGLSDAAISTAMSGYAAKKAGSFDTRWSRANVGGTVSRMSPFGAVWPRPIREVAFSRSSRIRKADS
jgi:hypothetical protein